MDWLVELASALGFGVDVHRVWLQTDYWFRLTWVYHSTIIAYDTTLRVKDDSTRIDIERNIK